MKSKILSRRRQKLFPTILIGTLFVALVVIAFREKISVLSLIIKHQSRSPMNYHANIIEDTRENTDFRRVLFTGPRSQLVLMSIPLGGQVGKETHKYTEQTLFFLSGTGEGELDGKKFSISTGDVVVVTAGTEHNFWNTGTQPLKIYTVYAPPNHIDGRIHHTKADADTDKADEDVGETAPLE